MRKWPRLVKKQIRQYQSEGFNWRRVASEKVFPKIGINLPKMRLARKLLLEENRKIIRKAQLHFGFEQPLYVIIYVGIGLGAGWATTYQKSPALLFGLENIAEESWTSRSEIKGLIAHEFGHLCHFSWRAKVGKRFRTSPLWDLYTGGFADRLERLLQEDENTHITKGSKDYEWLTWFQKNGKWLAREFLKRLHHDGDFRPFFGSWYQLRGHSQTGYYMGSEFIEKLEKTHSLKEIATLDNISGRMKKMLVEMVEGSV